MGPVVFNPHLVPMARGIAANIAIPLVDAVNTAVARELYEAHYSSAPFVRLLDGDALPETRHVRGSNRCDLTLRIAASGRLLLVFAAIDNLVKGAAGQAIQNWNRMRGCPEETGLPLMGWACA
jgi:N-acetyl-gamma-glutamyl-phosphate reductase